MTMLRGFRWQLLVMVMALVLFGISLISRTPSNPIPDLPTSTTGELFALSPVAATPNTTLPVVIAPPISDDVPTFREAVVGNVQRLNPLLANLNPVDRDISSLIFEGLSRIDSYGQPLPALAESWVISGDGLEYVIRLRQDVLWQDGILFSAADVVFTFLLLQATDFPGDPELATFWRTVEVQPLDNTLVRFRLTQPLGSFLDKLQIGILPEHALRGITAAQLLSHPFNLSPIGTGPYQLEALRSVSGSGIEAVDLRAAPVYRQRPEGQNGYTMDRVSFRLYNSFDEALTAFRNNAVDGIGAQTRADRSALLSLPNASIHTALEPTVGILIFNWAKDTTRFFREQRVRIALQTGLDRSSVVERYLYDSAVRADSPLIAGSWAYTSDLPWPPPDAITARQMMENAPLRLSEATEEPVAGGGRFSFRILTPDTPALASMAQEIAAQWSQLNISVTAEAVDMPTYAARLDASDFDAVLVELSLGSSADPDVYAFWDPGQYPDGKNYGGVDDLRIAERLEQARRDPSGINRAIHYHSFQTDFIERAIAIPLYYPLYTYATAPQISGVQLGAFVGTPANRFATIREWNFAPPS